MIASQSGHRLPSLSPEQSKALAMTPVGELLSLPMLQPDKVTDPLHAYQISKRGMILSRPITSPATFETGLPSASPFPMIKDIIRNKDAEREFPPRQAVLLRA